MNPFVNLKKRGISLPAGCKDLADVLKLPERRNDHAIKKFIRLILLQAQHDHATKLTIGIAAENGETPIGYETEGKWYDLAPIPSPLRPTLVAALLEMAQLPAASFPCEGTLKVNFQNVRLQWKVSITSADEECLLVPIHVGNELRD
jgi:hypothetical protein